MCLAAGTFGNPSKILRTVEHHCSVAERRARPRCQRRAEKGTLKLCFRFHITAPQVKDERMKEMRLTMASALEGQASGQQRSTAALLLQEQVRACTHRAISMTHELWEVCRTSDNSVHPYLLMSPTSERSCHYQNKLQEPVYQL